MDYWQIFLSLISVLWLIVAPVSVISGYFKLAEAANDIEHADRRELASENSGFITIDCGTDKDYYDERTGIFFKSDADFVSTGEIHNVSPNYDYEDDRVGRSVNSLRNFPQGRKNCYTLKPDDQTKHRYYYIRAYFYYGNYDGNNTFPIFDVYVGVSFWAGITNKRYRIESIHYILADTIDVCLVNTGTGTPFISALQLRPLLNTSIYKIGSLSLYGQLILDLGNSNDAVNEWLRPKDDAYNRYWTSYTKPDWVSINASDVNFPGVKDSNYKEVPVEVLKTAVEPAESGLNSLSYTYTNNYSSPYDYYFYFYFAELKMIEQGKQRQVMISLKDVSYGPIALDYLKPQIVRSDRISLQRNESVTFSVNSTVPDLPPILNAFELYVVWPWLTYSPTEAANVDAMLDIKRIYKVNREDWQGDPCIPIDVSWKGLRCSDGNFSDPPMIISLNLSSSNLDGEIVSSFSKLRAIQFLDLSYNKLNGTVPEFLGQLPNLTMLNLTGNNFTGPIPQSLIEKSKNGILQFKLDGNSECHGESCEKKKHGFVVPIAASILALLLILSVIAIVWKLKIPRLGNKSSFKSKNQRFTYSEIVSVTDNFRNIIGEGGFGKVYFGNLKDGTQVAVKFLSQSSTQGYKEFESEVQLLMVIHHRNLVSLIGYCDEPKNMALVYEYMQNGNLKQHLSDPSSTNVLSWIQRLQIAVDAAQGLEYLHNGCRPPIIHRDLKTSNILLDQNLQAKISDFGLSRAFATEKDSHVNTRPAGTFGYVDPEFVASGNLNKRSDVYSFGVILFEIITGQPVLMRGHESRTHILQWVGPEIESGDITGIIDPRLQGEFNTISAWKAVEIAMSCVPPTAIQRPDITQVLAELKECLAIEMESERPESAQRSKTSINFMSNSLEMSLPSAR